jgi:hypothetical protein
METCIQEALIHALTAAQPITWDQLQIVTLSDEDMMTLIETIKEGFTEQQNSLPQCLKEYHARRYIKIELSSLQPSGRHTSHRYMLPTRTRRS